MFAPTEEAFAALPSDVVDFLTSDAGKEALVETLQYHFVPKNLPAVNLEAGPVETTSGASIVVSMMSMDVFLNGDSKVEKADVLANNGLIHMISKVLQIPPSSAPTVSPTDVPTSPTSPPTDVPGSAHTVSMGLVGTIGLVLALVVL